MTNPLFRMVITNPYSVWPYYDNQYAYRRGASYHVSWASIKTSIIYQDLYHLSRPLSTHLSRYHLSINHLHHLQPIAFGVSFNLNLQSQSFWSLFNGPWQMRPGGLDSRLRFEIEETTLHMGLYLCMMVSMYLWLVSCIVGLYDYVIRQKMCLK